MYTLTLIDVQSLNQPTRAWLDAYATAAVCVCALTNEQADNDKSLLWHCREVIVGKRRISFIATKRFP